MNRNAFLKQSLAAGAAFVLTPLPQLLLANGERPEKGDPEIDLMKKLAAANDAQVEKLLQTDFDNREFGRRIGSDLNTLAASYCFPASAYYQREALLKPLEKLSVHLLRAQAADGTVNVGNLESPPDTAFVIEIVTAAAFLLQEEKSESLYTLKKNLKTFLLNAGNGLVTGGVHTPNHRWVVSAALARLNALYPDKRYLARIDDWLGEGIFNNSDGNYPERSRIYANVENMAFLTMARLLNRPALFEPVRKNLTATYYYTEPNGDLVTNDSRRQDQFPWRPDPNGSLTIMNYYLPYRYLAIRDGNNIFAAIAKMIEGLPDFEARILSRGLISFLEEPLLQKALPAAAPLQTRYEKLFAQSHLLRLRRESITTTFFGGCDQPVIIASGRSNSPDFYAYRKGEAVLKYMRLSTSFFSTGYFYSDGLVKTGSRYVLHKQLSVPYYQPLPKKDRKTGGDYRLSESIDGRFWNKMDFNHRPVSNVKMLDTTVSLTEADGKNELTFEVKGQAGVNVTVELCFKEGGKLTGVSAGEAGANFLESGFGKYEAGADTIVFGPGVVKHKSITGLEGERYSTHFGSLRTDGLHVYLTGITPFRHTLQFS